MKKIIPMLMAFLLLGNYVLSQQDTLFWFSPPSLPQGTTSQQTFLVIKSFASPAQLTVSQPANTGFATINTTVGANSVLEIDLSGQFVNLYSLSAGIVINNGVKIQSSHPVSVEWVTKDSKRKEDFSLKGKMALGKEFYTPAQKTWNNATGASKGFSFVASEDGTTVLVTPKAAIIGGNSSTFSVTLNKGQVYNVHLANINSPNQLDGSIVSSNKPIAITLYDNLVINGLCEDLMGDQMLSTEYLGNDFVVTRTSPVDKVYILAVENGTEVVTNDGASNSVVLSWGETYVYSPSTDFSSITTSKKVYAYHVAAKDCQMAATFIPNARCSGTHLARGYRKTTDPFVLNLYTHAGEEGGFMMNDAPLNLNGNSFIPVPGTNGSIVAISIPFSTTDLPAGSLVKVENNNGIFGMSTFNGSSTSNGSYFSFVSDFKVSSFANAGNDASTCANVGKVVHGVVGGGALGGNWTSTGFGTFGQSPSSLMNVYLPSPLDAIISPIKLILTSTGPCPIQRDTLLLEVSQLPIVNASIDQIVCTNNSRVQLNGSVQGGSTTGRWESSGSGQFSPSATSLNAIYQPSIGDLASGAPLTLTLSSINNGSCAVETDDLQIFFTQPATVRISTDSIFVCSNNPLVTLSGNVTGSSTTGKWISNGSGMFFPNNISLNTTYQPGVNDVQNGQFKVYLESTNNRSCLPVRDSVIVMITDSPVVDAGVNRTICIDQDTIFLSGSINLGFAVEWSGGSGTFEDISSLTSYYLPTQQEKDNGSVVLTLTSANNGNCIESSDVVSFTFVDIPHANFVVQDECYGVPHLFVNHSIAGFGSIAQTNWTFQGGGTSTLMEPTHTFPSSGDFTATLEVINSNGCSNEITKTVTVFSQPHADFSFETNCNFQSLDVAFTNHATAVDGITTYLYDLGGQVNFHTPDFNYSFNQVGTYFISQIVTSTNGCNDTIMKPLTVAPFPKAGFVYNYSSGLNVGTTFNFVDTSIYASTFLWDLGNGKISTLENPSAVYFENGHFMITQKVMNINGCFDSTSVWIEIKNVTNDITALIPNAISPNGDGYNDYWKLSFIELMYPAAEVFIFNQWGQLLFESKGYSTPWDGTHNGEVVPDGNYFYVIKLNNGDDKAIYKGTLLVLRSAK